MDDVKAQAWRGLADAARAFAACEGMGEKQALSDAAKRWAVASAVPVRESGGDVPVLPFGKSKGQPITSATVRDLEWVAGALAKSIDDPEKARWRDSNESLRAAILAELAARR